VCSLEHNLPTCQLEVLARINKVSPKILFFLVVSVHLIVHAALISHEVPSFLLPLNPKSSTFTPFESLKTQKFSSFQLSTIPSKPTLKTLILLLPAAAYLLLLLFFMSSPLLDIKT
jgi:hypothetical protein